MAAATLVIGIPTLATASSIANLPTRQEYVPYAGKVIGPNYDEMTECLSYVSDPNDPLTLFNSDKGTVTLNCAGLRHIAEGGHISYAPTMNEWHDFQTCVARVLMAEDFDRVSYPNWGRKRYNTYSSTWAYVVVQPNNVIKTAYTNGSDTGNWAGCTKSWI